MKKNISLILLLCILLALTGCGNAKTEESAAPKSVSEEKTEPHVPEVGETLAEALNSEHLRNILTENPVSVEIRIDHGGDLESAVITDSETLKTFAELFSAVTIAAETQECVTDNYNSMTLIFADGESVSLSLNLKNLEVNVNNQLHIYELEGFDSLWKLMNEKAQ